MTSIVMLIALAQFPSAPDKTPPIPQKTTPSPQAALATPQQSFAPQQDYAPLSLGSIQPPSHYVVRREVIVRTPVVQYEAAYDVAPECGVVADLAYAGDACGVVQQQIVRRNVVQRNVVVSHGLQQQVVVNHAVGVGAGRQPRKIVTKQVTKVRRGLFGR